MSGLTAAGLIVFEVVSPQETVTVLLALPELVKFTVMPAELPSSIGLAGPAILVSEEGELAVNTTVSDVAEHPLALVTVTE